MKRTITTLAILGMTLAGCNDDVQDNNISNAEGSAGELYFAYPADDQAGVPPSAPIFLRFDGPIGTSTDAITDALLLQDSNGNDVELENASLTADDRGIRVEPKSELTPGRGYSLSVSGLDVGGNVTDLEQSIEFSTAPSDTGSLAHRMDLASDGNSFEVARIQPYADGTQTSVGAGPDAFPVTDLSSFRLQFNEPVDEASIRYGDGDKDTIRLIDGDEELVEAEILVRRHRLTIDPDNNLTAGETYALIATDGIRSNIDGTALDTPEQPWTFTPLDSTSPNGERERMAQRAITDAGKLALSGENYNSVLLSSTTLGQDNETIQEGTVFAELGFIPRFDRADRSVPLRIDRSALLEGSNVEVVVGGEVPAGYGSGTVDVRFLSDANGYLMPNPYTDSPDAPRIVRLFLDLGLNTDSKRGNGALAQELLHVELVGTAIVEDGILTLEAVSIIEPNVLGVDKASGLISLRLENYESSEMAPSESDFQDTEAPSLKAWAPGPEDDGHQDKLQPQDSVSLFFDEPLLPSSITQETVTLRDSAGDPVESDIRQNGGNVIIDPVSPLKYDESYRVILDGDVLQDLAGNKLGGVGQNLRFSLPDTDTSTLASGAATEVGPMVLTARPGYPCAKADLKLNQDRNGRCLGGITKDAPTSQFFPEDAENPENVKRERDEFLPIEDHASDAPIIVRFSQNMDEATMKAGESVIIEKRSGDGSWQTVSDFILKTDTRSLRAVPLDGWETGATYRYTLTDDIQSAAGKPLYTKLFQQYDKDRSSDLDVRMAKLAAGGFDMVNRFQVVRSNSRVLNPLTNRPTLDANSDLVLNAAEKADGITEVPPNAAQLEMVGANSDVVSEAAIGCSVDASSCAPIDRTIAKTLKLDVEIGNERVTWDNGLTGIPVKLNPSVLFTTSSDVWIKLDSEFLAQIASDGDQNQRVPTGPMVMRMRYQKGSDGKRDDLIDGLIYTSDNGELHFRTKLDVYLDAPFLQSRLSSDLTETNLEDNMRSFEINDLALDGPITFFDDGRMQIVQKNMDPVNLGVLLRGQAEISFSDNNDCGAFEFFCNIIDNTINAIIDVDTDLTMRIPEKSLYLNYVSPYTQKDE